VIWQEHNLNQAAGQRGCARTPADWSFHGCRFAGTGQGGGSDDILLNDREPQIDLTAEVGLDCGELVERVIRFVRPGSTGLATKSR
jgi:hypothetical protein